MAFRIGETCNGCGLCARRCPTGCITGNKKERHVIDEASCIDCEVCGSYCAFDSVYDGAGNPTVFIKPNLRPRAAVEPDLCSWCASFVDICPFDCLEMTPDERSSHFEAATLVLPKKCVACQLCVLVCGGKEAIQVRWPDGELCVSLDDRKELPVPEARPSSTR